MLAVCAIRQRFDDCYSLAHVVLWKRVRIRPWVGESFVLLVQGLGQVQRLLRGELKPLVGLALERRQVEQLRRTAGDYLRLIAHRCGRSCPATCKQGVCLGLIPYAVSRIPRGFSCVNGRPTPAGNILPSLHRKSRVQLPVWPRYERANCELLMDDNRKRRRLHSADGISLPPISLRFDQGGNRSGSINANQPVCLRAAPRRIAQPREGGRWPKPLKCLTDRRRSHGLNPHPKHRLLCLVELVDQVKDKLALAACVASIDHLGHVGPRNQFPE